MVGGMFLILTLSSGFGFYNMSVYMNALAAKPEFAVADISAATALMFLVSGITGLGVAPLIERYDIRWVMTGGAAVGGSSLALMGVAADTSQVWALYAVFGMGNAAVSLIPGTTIVTRWFPGPERSVALAVVSTGLSTGGVLLTPISAVVIRNVGVELALPWFGLIFFVGISVVALTLVRGWPEGTKRSGDTGPPRPWLDWHAVRSRFFVGSGIAYILIMGAQVGAIAHLINHLEKVAGFATASASVSVLAVTSIVGRLLGGWIVTRFPIRLFTILNIVGQWMGLTVLAFADDRFSALGGTVLFGFTVGNLLMLQPLLLVKVYGVLRYPRVYSAAYALTTLGVAGGPLALGLLYQSFSYTTSFGVAGVCSIVALFIFCSAGPVVDVET
ncbi:MAG: MFS transporter [Gammaproteobacteria bacterium]|nr:MFS transporter [Gammaproteobacteria bacterium]